MANRTYLHPSYNELQDSDGRTEMTDSSAPSAIEHVQTKREIEQILDERGLHPRKRFGQHFLIDGNLMRRLADAAVIESGDTVLEVGPGTGGLTDLLANRMAGVDGRLVCVEIDRDLHAFLAERFRGNKRVELILGDVLAGKHELMPQVAELLASSQHSVKLVANLPYQAATPLIMNLLVDYPAVAQLCFTVQAEVGERITATPGGKDYGPLAIISQSVCDAVTLARIGPQSFWPRPAVDSVMLRLDVVRRPFDGPDAMRRFSAFVRGVFEHRRKRIRAAAAYVVSPAQLDMLEAKFDLSRRPEQVAIEQWIDLFRCIDT